MESTRKVPLQTLYQLRPDVLHMSTNNSPNETSFPIYYKLLNLVHFIKENNLNCHVVLPSPIETIYALLHNVNEETIKCKKRSCLFHF